MEISFQSVVVLVVALLALLIIITIISSLTGQEIDIIKSLASSFQNLIAGLQ